MGIIGISPYTRQGLKDAQHSRVILYKQSWGLKTRSALVYLSIKLYFLTR